jgi:hypothetical protein
VSANHNEAGRLKQLYDIGRFLTDACENVRARRAGLSQSSQAVAGSIRRTTPDEKRDTSRDGARQGSGHIESRTGSSGDVAMTWTVDSSGTRTLHTPV